MKLLGLDLDGTLIETASGKTFPEGIWDFKFKVETLEGIKNYDPTHVFIASNQAGIAYGYDTAEHFQSKLTFICDCIQAFLGKDIPVVGVFCADKDGFMRKPEPGMWVSLKSNFNPTEEDELLYVGDASGLPGDFSDSDKEFASRAGLPYMDIREFIDKYKTVAD